ncbi:MAG: hypothetical protein JKX76_02625 [Colwellia sp.]|nr:hypothetical protein [Colwellia sp.]
MNIFKFRQGLGDHKSALKYGNFSLISTSRNLNYGSKVFKINTSNVISDFQSGLVRTSNNVSDVRGMLSVTSGILPDILSEFSDEQPLIAPEYQEKQVYTLEMKYTIFSRKNQPEHVISFIPVQKEKNHLDDITFKLFNIGLDRRSNSASPESRASFVTERQNFQPKSHNFETVIIKSITSTASGKIQIIHKTGNIADHSLNPVVNLPPELNKTGICKVELVFNKFVIESDPNLKERSSHKKLRSLTQHQKYSRGAKLELRSDPSGAKLELRSDSDGAKLELRSDSDGAKLELRSDTIRFHSRCREKDDKYTPAIFWNVSIENILISVLNE